MVKQNNSPQDLEQQQRPIRDACSLSACSPSALNVPSRLYVCRFGVDGCSMQQWTCNGQIDVGYMICMLLLLNEIELWLSKH